jgi:chromate transporter
MKSGHVHSSNSQRRKPPGSKNTVSRILYWDSYNFVCPPSGEGVIGVNMDGHLLWQIFWLFTRVALFSWGGGPGSMGLMQRETVAAGWMQPEEFADGMALGNALPGPLAPQVSAFVGYKMAGTVGAIVAVTGTVLPTTILMLVVIIYFFSFKDKPAVRAMVQGVRPFVVGLLAWTTYEVARTVFDASNLGWGPALLQNWDKALIAIGTFLILNLTTVSPIWLVVVTAIIGLIFYRQR